MNYKLPTISVSIVTYNNESTLEERLGTLLPIFKDNNVAKVYIIDNHSNDKTLEKLKKIANTEDTLEIWELKKNKGFGFGHNQAIRSTTSDYHIVMNLDTTPSTESGLLNMVNYMEKHKDIDLLSPLIKFPDNSIQYLTRSEPTIFDLAIRFLGPNWFKKRQNNFVHKVDGYDHEQVIYNASGCFMFFRTKSVQSVGGFDERYFLYMEDTDLTKTINKNGKAVFSPNFEVTHQWQRKNHSFSGAKFMIKSMLKYFNKWGWKLW